jgi:hypothetical protein
MSSPAHANDSKKIAAQERLIVALDVANIEEAKKISC